MRGWSVGVLAAMLAVAGCGLDELDGRSDVAAAVGDHELSSDRVAEILGMSGGGATLQAAEFISNIWLDYSMFAEALATGRLKDDSATIARVMWPEIAQARVRLWHDSALASLGVTSPATVDSVYQAGVVRAFQHVISIPTGTTAADSVEAQQEIRRTLARVRGGEPFGAVAAEVGQDASKQDQGYLGVGPRGRFVPEFEDAAWALEPGEISDVVESQFGWHVIRRPSLEEARVRFTAFVSEQANQAKDSVFLAGLGDTYNLKVAGAAPTTMRNAATDPGRHGGSSRTLVSLRGDDLTVRDFVRWIGMFPQNVLMQIRTANDTVLNNYAEGLAQTTIMLRKADSVDLQLPGPQWQFVTLKYNEAVNTLRRDLGLDGPELSDSSRLTSEQRSKFAAERVEAYFQRLLSGQTQMQQVLPPIAADLRSAKLGRVHSAGVSRAVELALAQFRRDSASAPSQARPPEGIVPAPGGPPIGDSTGE